jgi:hypothetical protein
MPLSTLFKFVLAGLIGCLLGLTATHVLLQKGVDFSRIKVGPWMVSPKSGAADSDPYARAHLAQTGEVALAHAEGLSFVAASDSDGHRLEPNCDYIVSGRVPDSRAWSLTLLTQGGALIDNLSKRYGFTSAEILRAADGTFEINVARSVHSGNWLPVATRQPFRLMLRLYDTLLDFGTSKLDEGVLPRITRASCT